MNNDPGAVNNPAEFELLRKLNGITADNYPYDETLRARIRSYELAFRMQAAVPEVVTPFGNRRWETTL